MRNFDKKEFWAIFGVVLFTLFCEIIFFYKQGTPLFDTGREFYIPQQVYHGGVLYKDIFNIYGPLSYQFNAFLYSVFGVHTDVLHYAGNITAIGIIVGTYLLAREFLPRFYSVLISIFLVLIAVCKTGVFNYVLPYSFAVIYGLLSVIFSVLFLVKYVKTKNNKFIYLSLFLAGVAVDLKYDYFPYLLVYLYVLITFKPRISEILKGFLSFVSIPFFSLLLLIKSGLNFEDIVSSYNLFKSIAGAPSLTVFYRSMGVYPTFPFLIKNISYLCVFSLLCFVVYKALSFCKNKVTYGVLFSSLSGLLIYLGYLWDFPLKFTFLPLLILVALIGLNKKIQAKDEIVLYLSSLLISVKSFFWAGIGYYSLFYFPLLIISAVLLFFKHVSKRENIFKTVLVIIVLSISYTAVWVELKEFHLFTKKFVTHNGVQKVGAKSTSVQLVTEVLLNKTKKTDKVVILPEGHMINFLSGRRTDDFYSNLIPMYVEAFGESRIISHFVQNSPEYFIFVSRDTAEYGKKFICKDYAQNLCDWIFNNYHVAYTILGEPEYIVLRKNQ